ncbi:MAG: hypothetical protein NTZ05_14990 [Chloroflexi bacterium]|nr:hypothetical protein [Chloroflexota bacterium]
MAKSSGITAAVTVQDNGAVARTISNDITSIDVSTPRGSQDITGLDKTATERLLLRTDGKVTINGVFNTTANMSHDVFKTVPASAAVPRQIVITYPGPAVLTLTCILTDYAVKEGADGSLTWSVPGELSNGTPPVWS